jgi:hypothetical protein
MTDACHKPARSHRALGQEDEKFFVDNPFGDEMTDQVAE